MEPMTSAHLVACPFCARHVRVDETTCPFCGSVVPNALRRAEPRRPPAERLSRAALYAFGVGTLSVATAGACSSPPQLQPFYGAAPFDAGYGGAEHDGTGSPAYGGPLYGGSFVSESGPDSPVDAALDHGSFSADADGAPPKLDAGLDATTDASDGSDQ
jgi:hypothetical protein